MNCELSAEELVAYLHGEAEPARKGAIAAHLEGCPACQEKCAELQQTRRLLAAWAEEEPPAKLVFVPQRRKALGADWKWRRLGWGISLAAAAALAILALGRSQIEYGQGRLRLQWSLADAPAPDSLAMPLTRAEFLLAQQQSLELFQQAIQSSQLQQRQELGQTLARFAVEMEKQRQEDLKLVAQGLQAMDWSTADRFSRTEGLLQQLLVAAGY